MYRRLSLQFHQFELSLKAFSILLNTIFPSGKFQPVPKDNKKDPEYLRVTEVAATFSVTERTVWRWLKNKYIESIRLGGRTVFDKVYLLEHVAANKANKNIR